MACDIGKTQSTAHMARSQYTFAQWMNKWRAYWLEYEEHKNLTNKYSMQTASRACQQMIERPGRTGTSEKNKATLALPPRRPFCPQFPKDNIIPLREIPLQHPFQRVPDPRAQELHWSLWTTHRHNKPYLATQWHLSLPQTSHAFISIPNTTHSTHCSHSIYVCTVNEQMNEQTNHQRKCSCSLS